MAGVIGLNIEGLSFTKHARERYAERIMHRDNARDINVFVAENTEKIEKDIKNMIQYGEEIFTGKPSFNNPKQHNCIYILNDLWVVVVDAFDNKVITLYRIDLGAGEDFDVAFKRRLMDKITEAKTIAEAAKTQIDTETSQYMTIIKDNSEMIAEFKKKIKNLESINEAYSSTIEAANKRKAMAEDDVKNYVATLVGRKTF